MLDIALKHLELMVHCIFVNHKVHGIGQELVFNVIHLVHGFNGHGMQVFM